MPRGLLRCPGSPWTPTARTFALLSLNAKGFKTRSALTAILSTPSITRQLGDPGRHSFAYPTDSIECLLYACERVAPALVGKRVLSEAGGVWGGWPGALLPPPPPGVPSHGDRRVSTVRP